MTIELGMPKIRSMNQIATISTAIIDAIGGTVSAARLCRVKPPSVSDWKKYGIPDSRLQVIELTHPELAEKCDELRAAASSAARAAPKSVDRVDDESPCGLCDPRSGIDRRTHRDRRQSAEGHVDA